MHVHLDAGELDAARVYATQAVAEVRSLGRVLVTRMRGLGLRDIIVGTEEGYSFAPEVQIEFV
jgi:hypothetical protein